MFHEVSDCWVMTGTYFGGSTYTPGNSTYCNNFTVPKNLPLFDVRYVVSYKIPNYFGFNTPYNKLGVVGKYFRTPFPPPIFSAAPGAVSPLSAALPGTAIVLLLKL